MLQYALFDLARRLRAIGVSVGVSAEDRKPYSATPIIRLGAITSADVGHCSSRPTFCSIEAKRRPCYAWVTVAGQALWEFNNHEMHLVLRINQGASNGNGA
jgi:hypothetical protein